MLRPNTAGRANVRWNLAQDKKPRLDRAGSTGPLFRVGRQAAAATGAGRATAAWTAGCVIRRASIFSCSSPSQVFSRSTSVLL